MGLNDVDLDYIAFTINSASYYQKETAQLGCVDNCQHTLDKIDGITKYETLGDFKHLLKSRDIYMGNNPHIPNAEPFKMAQSTIE